MTLRISEEELRRQFEEEFGDDIERELGLGPPKPARVSLSMIARRNLPPSVTKESQDHLIEGLMKLTHIRLDRENISEIDNLEMLGPVTNLYLQRNGIKKIENLECMTSLQFLTLAGNKIERIENLRALDTLKLLDLSDNRILDLNTDELPKSVVFLDLQNNPCTESRDYRRRVLAALPNLKQLDGQMLTREEKPAAGHPISSDEEEEEEEDEDNRISDGGDAVNIEDVFRLSADFIHQSRERAAQYANEHDLHMHQIEEVRSQSQQAMATPTMTPRSPGTPSQNGSRHFTPSPASR